MAVDRGGLRYTIEVRDQFTKQFKRFRTEVAAVKKELSGLRSAQAQVNTARTAGDAGASAANREQLQRLRQLSAGIKQKSANEALAARINRTQRQEASRAAREDIALFRRQKNEEAKANSQRVAALRRQQAAQAKANGEVAKGSKQFRKLTSSAKRSEGAINRVSFTFRRLIGIFAAFQAARAGGRLFSSFISDSLQYTRTIEDSQISMASLFTTAGRVRNEQGEMLKGAEAFGAAQAEAARQTRLVQSAAVSTTATFQELLRAFQAGIGPGLEAGLQLDEIREITVRVSQAAAALAIPQNQLVEEIRSLLRGTIQARTTIVASVLGITNKDVADAKKAGNLFNFLSERLEGFKFAAGATQQSFGGLLARLKDSFQLAGGNASIKLFDQLKVTFAELADTFVKLERDTEGNVTGLLPNEDAVAAAEAFFSRIADALQILREGLQQITSNQIGNVLGAIGEIARVLSAAIAGFMQGLIAGLSRIAAFVNAISAGFGGGSGVIHFVEQFGVLLGESAAIIGVVVAATLLLKGVWFLLGPAVSLVTGAVKGLGLLTVGLVKTVGLLPARFLPIVGIILGIVAGFRRVFSSVVGFGVTFEETILLIILAFQDLWGRVTIGGKIAFQTIANSLAAFFQAPLQTIAQSFADLFGGILELISGFQAIVGVSQKTRDNIEDAIAAVARFASGKRPPPLFDTEKSKDELDAFLLASENKFAALANAAAIRDADENTLFDPEQAREDADDLLSIIGELSDKFGTAFTDFTGFDFEAASAALADGLVDKEAITEKMQDAVKAFIEGVTGSGNETEKTKLTKFFDGIVENFESGLTIVRGLVTSLSNFIADSLVDALDPTTDTDLLERFAKFLQQIAKLIIQQLVQVAIAKAVLGAFGNSTGGLGTQAGSLAGGLAEGGPVPDGHGVPAFARPKGLDSRDTTPIFAQPGEFMMKLAAVKNYGGDVMNAINRGLIDPSALKALISGKGSTRHISGMSSRGPAGYAEGGIIRQQAAAGLGAAGTADGSSNGNKPQPAVVVGNDQTMEKLLNGGSQAFRRYLQDNAQEFDGILRGGRTG
tara:strand:+ start:28512 stop:31703 length:3192 start_codon:yes stop_codon:yes gene_type:complete